MRIGVGRDGGVVVRGLLFRRLGLRRIGRWAADRVVDRSGVMDVFDTGVHGGSWQGSGRDILLGNEVKPAQPVLEVAESQAVLFNNAIPRPRCIQDFLTGGSSGESEDNGATARFPFPLPWSTIGE